MLMEQQDHVLKCQSVACRWIINQPSESLPYILHDAGYDVWMGNSRGNTYSMSHVKYNPTEPQFWDFSW